MPWIFWRRVRTLLRSTPGHLGVELALQRILQIDDLDEMGPGQQSRQCLDYLDIIEDLGKTDHVKHIAAAKALPVLRCQPLAHQLDNFRPVLGPVLGWQILADAFSDLPVKHNQLGVHRLSDTSPCLLYEGPDAADKLF